MTDENRVRQLLQQSLDLDLTPEQVCASHLEFLPAVRQRWERCHKITSELDSIFATQVHGGDRNGANNEGPSWTELPTISGYVIESFLGRGGVGIVFKAQDLRLDRVVALKMLLCGASVNALARARFVREARSIAAVRHQHILQIYDVGESAGLPFFTMDFLEGGTLAERLKTAPASIDLAAIKSAAHMIATLADAIACAHEVGVIHRDLKPANILLTAEGVAKIGDFGLAKNMDGGDALTLTGVRMGTLSYMAPEQATGSANATSPAADIYALGAILYEMIGGRPPFRGKSAADTLMQLIENLPTPPSQLNPLVPRDLEIICLRCLQKDPRERYASATALAVELRRFIQLHAQP